MSSTTRVGFTIPASTDFADEIIFYDNNITIYEAELPSQLVSSLPPSGSYTGQVRTVALPATTLEPQHRFHTYVWNGTAWVSIGQFGYKKNYSGASELQPGDYVAATSAEVFQADPIPGFNQIQVGPNQAVRFGCNISTNSIQAGTGADAGAGSTIFTGKFNIFINPSSSSQPNPTTPGAVKLSFPLVHGDDGYAIFGPNPNSVQYHYGELLYLPSVSSQTTMGVAAYLSATFTDDYIGTRVYGGSFTGSNISSSTITVETLGEM